MTEARSIWIQSIDPDFPKYRQIYFQIFDRLDHHQGKQALPVSQANISNPLLEGKQRLLFVCNISWRILSSDLNSMKGKVNYLKPNQYPQKLTVWQNPFRRP